MTDQKVVKEKHPAVIITEKILWFIWIIGALFTTGAGLTAYTASEMTVGLFIKVLSFSLVGWPLVWGLSLNVVFH
jgi:hypothetical protein